MYEHSLGEDMGSIRGVARASPLHIRHDRGWHAGNRAALEQLDCNHLGQRVGLIVDSPRVSAGIPDRGHDSSRVLSPGDQRPNLRLYVQDATPEPAALATA